MKARSAGAATDRSAELMHRREWLVASAALQRLQLTLAARRIDAHCARADGALRPWLAAGAVALPLLVALRSRRPRWASLLASGLAGWRLIATFSRR